MRAMSHWSSKGSLKWQWIKTPLQLAQTEQPYWTAAFSCGKQSCDSLKVEATNIYLTRTYEIKYLRRNNTA